MPRPPKPTGSRRPARPTPAPDEGEFARLLAEERPRRFAPVAAGDRVEGVVIAVTTSTILVDIGQRSEGVVPLEDLRPEDRERLRIGARAEFLVSRVSSAGIELSAGLAAHKLDLTRIQDAMNAGMPIEGRVTGDNKGGFTVDLPGVKGFVPFSQMELGAARPPGEYVGRSFRFRVLEVRGRDVILSRAALLREEQERERQAVLERLEEGQELSVPVVKVERFGVFVDLGGGVHALVPTGEIAWSDQDGARAALASGVVVTVKIIEIAREGPRPKISASMRQATPDPWLDVDGRFREGQVVRGRVARLAPFGAFVEIAPGVQGLLHVSEMSATRRIQSPNEAVRLGQSVEVAITSVDAAARRIALSIVQVPEAEIDPDLRAKYIGVANAADADAAPRGVLAEAFERARRRAEEKARKKR